MPILGITASQITGRLAVPDTGAMFPLGMVQVGSGGSASISFSSIPSTYKHLQIRYLARDTSADNDGNSVILRFNSDSGTNYVRHYMLGTGTSALSGAVTSTTGIDGGLIQGGGGLATCYSAGVIDILDYTSTSKYKTVRSLSGNSTNASTAVNYVEFESGLWLNTAAITSVTISSNSGNLAQYSSFALYGIKGA